ncbi:MAG: adenylate cyclase [Oscillospiraceae bacterium]|nr:adenylate cyclase [Oscillospiraceae bacterium]
MSIFKTTLRIKADTPEGRKALGYLKSRDKTRYHSYSDAIIAAVNGYFDRERQLADDPYLETREKEDAFLQRILETVERGKANPLNALAALLQNVQPAPDTKAIENDLDTAIDFIDSL